MIETANLKLKKYEDSDVADPSIGVNPNMDIIDAEIKKLQVNKSDNTHNHDDRYYTEAEVNEKLSGKSNSNHNHDDRYYTETEINLKLNDKANTSHNHTKNQITDFSHTHPMNEITGLSLEANAINYNKNGYAKVDGALDKLFTDNNTNKTSILSLQKNDGDLKTLKTTDKSNLVGAINELFQNANNGKNIVATSVGSPLLATDTFATIGSKIDALTLTLQNNLKSKGVDVPTAAKMSNLIDEVAKIETYNLPSWISKNGFWIDVLPCTVKYENMLLTSINNKIYAFGGILTSYRSEMYEYDINLNIWNKVSTTVPSYILSDSLVSCSVGTNIYVIGGLRNGSASSNNDVFDTLTNTWTSKTRIPTPSAFSPCLSHGTNIYVIGGSTINSSTSTHNKNQCYDTLSNTWTEKSPVPSKVFKSLGCSVDNFIYIIGGDYDNSTETRRKNSCYDVLLDAWTTKLEIPIVREYLAMGGSAIGVIKDKIYVFSKSSMGGTFVYDTLNDLWSKDENISPLTQGAYAISFDSGCIYVKTSVDMKCLVSNEK